MAQTEYQRQYYIKNKERILTRFKDRYAEDPEKFIERTTKYHNEHPEVSRKAGKKWEANNPEKLKVKQKTRYAKNKEYFYDWHLKSKYGISIDDYKELYNSQNGKCLICEKEKTLIVDHDHETGKVRGLLCHACNTSLGFMEENVASLENAIRYLQEHK